MSSKQERDSLKKVQELMCSFPKSCLAATIAHAMDLLKLEDFVTTKELIDVMKEDKELT